MRPVWLAVGSFALAVASHRAFAYQADLVPASNRPEARDITGTVSISDEGGNIRVSIESVNDEKGDPLDSNKLVVHLKLRIAGERHRITVPLGVDAGDGEATATLGLGPDVPVTVNDIRVRGPNRRTIAVAGLLTVTAAVVPPPAPPPPPPDQCPAALSACQDDLRFCNEELDSCEAGE